MATIANAIDFFQEEVVQEIASIFGSKSSQKSKNGSAGTNLVGMKAMLYMTYFIMGAVILHAHDVALIQWREGWTYLSFSYFMGSSFEFMGLAFLSLRVHTTKSVAGISSQSMALFVISLAVRVFTTTAFEGYLPVDRSGDRLVQTMDTCSLLCAMYLLYAAQKKYACTYQQEDDTMPIAPILMSCAICSYCIRGVLNRNWIFDTLWAFSLDVEVFQLLPQLYMMSKIGGTVDTATAHFVVNIVASCFGRFIFWLWAVPGCKELSTPEGYAWDMAMGGKFILGAYTIQSLISLDFMYYFVKSWWKGQKTVELPQADEI
jgi:hypothetical protein